MAAAVLARRALSLDVRTRVHVARAAGREHGRGRWGLRLVGAAALTLLFVLACPALAHADPLTPAAAPSAAPAAGNRPTPNPQAGPSPQAPSGTPGASPAPAAPAPAAPATPSSPPGSLPWAADVPPTGLDDSTPDTSTDPGSTGTCTDDAADCSPQPSTPPPPSAHTTPTAPDTGGSGGGGIVGWITRGITSAINAFFRGLVTAALDPLLDLLGKTLLTTPTPSQIPAIGQLWTTSWEISVAGYGILIMAGGITIMMFGTVQTRTSVKEIAPRIPVGFLAAALSQFLAGKAIELANPLPGKILGQGVDPDTASKQLRNIVLGAISSPGPSGEVNRSIFVIFLGLFLAGGVVALLCTYIARVVLTVSLIGAAPLALAGHALPQTEKVAFWWWRAFFSCLGIQIAQSFVLTASFKVFFTPGGFTVFGPTPDGVVNLLAAITMIYFLFKIPFWMMPRIGGGGGSGVLGRIVRAYITGRAMGLLGGGRFGSRNSRTASPARTPSRPGWQPRAPRPAAITSRPLPRGRTSPVFLQPLPAVSVHHLANGKAVGPPPPAVFQAPATPGAGPDQTVRPRPRPSGPPGMPVFRSPDDTGTPSTPPATARTFRPPPGASTRVRFQPPGPEPTSPSSSTPIRPRGPVAPATFRAPDAARRADGSPRVSAPGLRARTGTAMPVLFSSPAPGRVSPPMPPPTPRVPATPPARRARPAAPRPSTPQTPRTPAPRTPAPRPSVPRPPARGVPMPRFTAPPPGGPRP